jgi:hypothetical protein
MVAGETKPAPWAIVKGLSISGARCSGCCHGVVVREQRER